MRKGSARTNTATRVAQPVRPWTQKPQPITADEAKAAAMTMTEEECRRVVGIALRRGWAWAGKESF